VAGGPDRYEPLPPIARLPAFLWRRIGRAGRALVAVVVAAALIGGVLSIPGIRESKEQARERDARVDAQRRESRERELRALVRPRVLASLSVPRLEAAIARDARRRTGDDILRADCEPDPRGGGRLACLAVTAEIPRTDLSSGGRLGHPYSALADRERGRITYCRAFGVPAEGALRRRRAVTIPRACGGGSVAPDRGGPGG